MSVKADQERIKTLLTETITLLCRNGLNYKSEFSVEALIGITVDRSDVFLVNIKELVQWTQRSPGDRNRDTDNETADTFSDRELDDILGHNNVSSNYKIYPQKSTPIRPVKKAAATCRAQYGDASKSGRVTGNGSLRRRLNNSHSCVTNKRSKTDLKDCKKEASTDEDYLMDPMPSSFGCQPLPVGSADKSLIDHLTSDDFQTHQSWFQTDQPSTVSSSSAHASSFAEDNALTGIKLESDADMIDKWCMDNGTLSLDSDMYTAGNGHARNPKKGRCKPKRTSALQAIKMSSVVGSSPSHTDASSFTSDKNSSSTDLKHSALRNSLEPQSLTEEERQIVKSILTIRGSFIGLGSVKASRKPLRRFSREILSEIMERISVPRGSEYFIGELRDVGNCRVFYKAPMEEVSPSALHLYRIDEKEYEDYYKRPVVVDRSVRDPAVWARKILQGSPFKIDIANMDCYFGDLVDDSKQNEGNNSVDCDESELN